MKGLVRFRCFFLAKMVSFRFYKISFGGCRYQVPTYTHHDARLKQWSPRTSTEWRLLVASKSWNHISKSWCKHRVFLRFSFMAGSWPFKTTTKNTRNHNQQPIQHIPTTYSIYMVWDILEKIPTPPRWHWWRIWLDFQEKHHGTTDSLPMSK